VVQQSFPHGPDRQKRKMTFLSLEGVYSKMGRPYNPLIAEERGAKRRRARKQATEITKKLEVSAEGSRELKSSGFRKFGKTKIENRVLTDGNVSTTTRHVDDVERTSLPLFSVF
jgi:hypothetical protein